MSQPRPLYVVVDRAYPRKSQGYDWAKLFNSIGWDDLVGNMSYYNTCAIRISIALLSAGYKFPGRMSIKAGPLKGKRNAPGQRELSDRGGIACAGMCYFDAREIWFWPLP